MSKACLFCGCRMMSEERERGKGAIRIVEESEMGQIDVFTRISGFFYRDLARRLPGRLPEAFGRSDEARCDEGTWCRGTIRESRLDIKTLPDP